MAVPNLFPVVERVYASGDWDLSTSVGCGLFIEACAPELKKIDSRVGHLRKPPSRTNWNGHAVDNILYLSDTPGRSTAVDIIVAGGSTSARIGWKEDEPRYSIGDWIDPADVMPWKLPPHDCHLGASLFWLLGGWRLFRDQVIAHLHWYKDRHVDVVRALFCCAGTKPWAIIGSDPNWPDFAQTVREAQAYCASIGMQIAWTLVGEGARVPTLTDQLALVDYYHQLVHDEYLSEMWNEHELTGGTKSNIRQMAQRLRGLRPSARIALDTPMSAMSAPIGEQPDALPDEVTRFYGGSAADAITPQFDRTLHDPRYLGPDAPAFRVLMEPRGLDSTVVDVNDPVVFGHDYVMGVVNRYKLYVLQSKPGVWGGHCHPDFPNQNTPANIWDFPEAEAVAAQVASVRLGTWPLQGDLPVPLPPYDEQWIINTVDPAFVALYRKYSHPLDAIYPVWSNRTLYDHCAGMSQADSLAKHLQECEAALAGG